MKILLLVLAMLIGCNVTLLAKIGDTEAQIEAKLGKPFSVLTDSRKNYAFGPFNVCIRYIDRVSENEMFVKQDHSALSQKEIMHLLNYENGGFGWGRQSNRGDVVNWRSADGWSRMAVYDGRRRFLVIWSKKFLDTYANAATNL